jgi:hypothetical protein
MISSELSKICVDAPAFTGAFGLALDLAIQNTMSNCSDAGARRDLRREGSANAR